MANERNVVLVGVDKDGMTATDMPVTRVNNVEGIGRVMGATYYPGDVVYADTNNAIALICTAGGVTSSEEIDFSGVVVGGTVEDGGVVWLAIARGYAIATQAEAEAGMNNKKVMTPLRVKEAFAGIEDYINSFKPPTDNVLSIAGYHNSIYRGKYLGSALIAAQSAAIRAGTFDDMFIGDYWIINGTTYVIAAFDYYYNCGDAACTTHHITVVPLRCMYYGSMNSTNITTGAYVGSAMYTSGLDQAKNTIANDFGSDHILVIRQLFQDSVDSSGYENTAGSWVDATVWLMNEVNVYGTIIWKNAYAGTNWRGNYFVDNSQYPLFALNPRMIHIRENYWLRDVADSANVACVGDGGNCVAGAASGSHGVRPAFNIY